MPNGLLGITIEGQGRFDLYDTETRADGLVLGEVEYRAEPEPAAMLPQWQSMLDVLRSLETHPHVQRMARDLLHHLATELFELGIEIAGH